MTAADTDPMRSEELAPLRRVEFDELYRTKYTPMIRLAYVLVDTIGDAEHVVQDAFVALYRRYDTVLAPEAYLRTSVVNGARKVLRRRRVVRRRPADPPALTTP
jgi:DNA-directed RNA polymerase specialized sigma24 family protein